MSEGYGLFEEEKLKVKSTRRMKMEEGGRKVRKGGRVQTWEHSSQQSKNESCVST